MSTLIKVQAPVDGGGFNWQGKEYSLDANGQVEVPQEALADIEAFGYCIALPAESKEKPKPKK